MVSEILPPSWKWAVGIPFGIVFIGCLSVLLVSLADRERIKRSKFTNLGNDEKEVLRAYIEQSKMTIPFVVADARPKSLASEGFLFKSSDTEAISKGFIYYTIQSWVFNYFKKNSHLLGL